MENLEASELETFNQSDEGTWPDRLKDDDNDNNNNDEDILRTPPINRFFILREAIKKK